MKIKHAFSFFFFALFMISCSASLSTKFDDYVTQVELDCRDWTEDEWEFSLEEYNRLLQEYENNYSTLTQEEKDAINRAIGRYNGLLVKRGIKTATGAFQELGERIPSLIEGFMSAFGNEDNQ